MSKANKLKLIKHRDEIRFEVTADPEQHVNEREMISINEGDLKGVLPMEASQKGRKLLLTYDLSGLISLPEYLKLNPMSRSAFVGLVTKIVNAWKEMEAHCFDDTLIRYSPESVMVYPPTFTPLFVYLPLRPAEADGNLQTLLQSLIGYASFEDEEDMSFVQEYVRLVNEPAGLSVFSLEEYLKRFGKKTEYCFWELVREKTGERIPLKAFPFKLGRQAEETDYCVMDNPTVGRIHATLTQKEQGIFITDCESKNGTMVNGIRVYAASPKLLSDGDRIRLSNEEFTFLYKGK